MKVSVQLPLLTEDQIIYLDDSASDSVTEEVTQKPEFDFNLVGKFVVVPTSSVGQLSSPAVHVVISSDDETPTRTPTRGNTRGQDSKVKEDIKPAKLIESSDDDMPVYTQKHTPSRQLLDDSDSDVVLRKRSHTVQLESDSDEIIDAAERNKAKLIKGKTRILRSMKGEPVMLELPSDSELPPIRKKSKTRKHKKRKPASEEESEQEMTDDDDIVSFGSLESDDLSVQVKTMECGICDDTQPIDNFSVVQQKNPYFGLNRGYCLKHFGINLREHLESMEAIAESKKIQSERDVEWKKRMERLESEFDPSGEVVDLNQLDTSIEGSKSTDVVADKSVETPEFDFDTANVFDANVSSSDVEFDFGSDGDLGPGEVGHDFNTTSGFDANRISNGPLTSPVAQIMISSHEETPTLRKDRKSIASPGKQTMSSQGENQSQLTLNGRVVESSDDEVIKPNKLIESSDDDMPVYTQKHTPIKLLDDSDSDVVLRKRSHTVQLGSDSDEIVDAAERRNRANLIKGKARMLRSMKDEPVILELPDSDSELPPIRTKTKTRKHKKRKPVSEEESVEVTEDEDDVISFGSLSSDDAPVEREMLECCICNNTQPKDNFSVVEQKDPKYGFDRRFCLKHHNGNSVRDYMQMLNSIAAKRKKKIELEDRWEEKKEQKIEPLDGDMSNFLEESSSS